MVIYRICGESFAERIGKKRGKVCSETFMHMIERERGIGEGREIESLERGS